MKDVKWEGRRSQARVEVISTALASQPYGRVSYYGSLSGCFKNVCHASSFLSIRIAYESLSARASTGHTIKRTRPSTTRFYKKS